MNALHVMKALLDLSEQDQEAVIEFWMTMRKNKVSTPEIVEDKPKEKKKGKRIVVQYSSKEYEFMKEAFHEDMRKNGRVLDSTWESVAKSLGRTSSAIRRAAWTFVNDPRLWEDRYEKSKLRERMWRDAQQ